MTPQTKKYTKRSRSYHDFFLCHELENYRIIFYHTENRGVSRNNLCHEFANLRIISYNHTENRGIIFLVTNLRICEFPFSHTENHGIIFVTNLRICELFLLITRRIAEGHGRQKFANSKITSLRSVGPRTSLVTRKIRDRPRYSV